MAEHRIGTREEWQAARDELAKLEAEQAERNQEVSRKRRELPWVPVEKEYEFETEDGKKTLADLLEGRSQLLAYNVMYVRLEEHTSELQSRQYLVCRLLLEKKIQSGPYLVRRLLLEALHYCV